MLESELNLHFFETVIFYLHNQLNNDPDTSLFSLVSDGETVSISSWSLPQQQPNRNTLLGYELAAVLTYYDGYTNAQNINDFPIPSLTQSEINALTFSPSNGRIVYNRDRGNLQSQNNGQWWDVLTEENIGTGIAYSPGSPISYTNGIPTNPCIQWQGDLSDDYPQGFYKPDVNTLVYAWNSAPRLYLGRDGGQLTFPTATGTLALTSDIKTYSAGTGLSLTSNTFSVDSTIVTLTGSQTLTNKTLTSPVISTITNGAATLTLPSTTTSIVGTTTSQTLTNKTLTAPIMSSFVNGSGQTITVPSTATTLIGTNTTNNLSNKNFVNSSCLFVDGTDTTKRLGMSTSGSTTATTMTLSASTTADRTLTLPDATDTLIGRETTDTLTNKTLSSPSLTGVLSSNTDVMNVLTFDSNPSLITSSVFVRVAGYLSFFSRATPYTITVTLNTPVELVPASSITQVGSLFDEPQNGRIRYLGSIAKTFRVWYSISALYPSNNRNYLYTLYKNGVGQGIFAGTHSHTNLYTESSTNALITMTTNDYLSIFVTNITNSETLTVPGYAILVETI